MASSSRLGFLIVLFPFVFLLFHSLARSFDAPALISNIYSYCSIYVYKTVLVRGQAPELAIRRLHPLIQLACFKISLVFPVSRLKALNAQVSKVRFLTQTHIRLGVNWTKI